MNAQVFFLKKQMELYRQISPLLKRHIFDDESIEIDQLVIDDDYTDTEQCQNYLTLLKAGMISTSDFNLMVEDAEGNWSYMGKGYQSSGGTKLLRLLRKSMPAVFPAVSVMDRMVMVPKGIHDELAAESFTWMLKPLEMGGVLLVDFQDMDSVREAARQVGMHLRTVIAKLCRRHMLMNRSSSPNFDTLCELLKIEQKYFKKHEEEILASMVQLVPKIVSGPTQLGRPSRVILDIRNESEKELEHVRVQVRAPCTAMKVPVVKTLDFPASTAGAQRIQFEISPKAAPYCPLEVLFEISETSQLYAPFSASLILDVSP